MPNQQLKRERQLRGWSQAYLAEQIHAPARYISRWERGEVSPSPYYQQKLCELFGVTAEQLGFLSLEKTLNAPIELEKTHLLSNDVWRRPSTLLVMAISRSWIRRQRVVLLALLLLLLLGMSASGLLASPTTLPLGSFSFTSSGSGPVNSSEGMADALVLHVHLDRQSMAGERYYTWLMPDQNNPEGMIVPLGTLSSQGDLSYRDPASTNLLLSHSTVLITEQRASPVPDVPSLDQTDWRFRGMIDQQHAPGTPYSLLDHLRHLFAIDPEVEGARLHGGLVAWLAHNTTQVATLAKDAQQQHNGYASHQDLLRMLEDLDGTTTVAQDLPETSFPVNPQAKIGLLTLFPEQSNPGYVQHIENHLRGMITSPGVSHQQQILANQSLAVLDEITAQLQQTRETILHLLKHPTNLQFATLTEHAYHASQSAQHVSSEMIQLLTFEIPS